MAETLAQAVLDVGVDDSRLRAGLKGVEQQATATGAAIGRSFGGNTLGGLKDRLAEVRRQLDGVENGSKAFRQLQRDANQLEKELDRVQRRTNQVTSALDAARNVLVTVGAVQVFKDLINSATELENITRKLSNTLGDQGAQQALGFLRGLSDNLGLSFNVLADSFGSFTAAASAANIPLKEQEDLFSAVSTSAQRLGLSNDAINGSLLALQQVASKGTVQMEELRGQLGERLPTAFAATAQGLGITNAELIKLVESGKLTAEQFFPALTKGLNELNGSGGASLPTATQNFASLGNELEKLKAQVGTDFLPGVVEGVQKLSQVLAGLNVQIEANKLGFGQGLLGNLFGVVSAEGAQAVGTLQQLAKTYGLSQKQARALFTDAVKDVGASTNAFGQLNLTAEQYQKILEQLPRRAEAFTRQGREATAEQQQAIKDARQATAEDEKRLNTFGKIKERIKTLQKESEGLDLSSSKFKENQAEIAQLEAQTAKGAKKLADAGIKIREEIEKGAASLVEAGKSLQRAEESAANAVVGNLEIASDAARRKSRETLEADIRKNLQSDSIDPVRFAQKFGAGLESQRVRLGADGVIRQQQLGTPTVDLSSLSLEALKDASQQTSALADAHANVVEAQKDLAEATKELTSKIAASNERESNLAITVPVGEQRQVYLP